MASFWPSIQPKVCVVLALLCWARLGRALYEKGDPVTIVTARSFEKVEKSPVPVVVVSTGQR